MGIKNIVLALALTAVVPAVAVAQGTGTDAYYHNVNKNEVTKNNEVQTTGTKVKDNQQNTSVNQNKPVVESWTLGREGKMMQVGENVSRWLKAKRENKAKETTSAAVPTQATVASKPVVESWTLGREGKMMQLGENASNWLKSSKSNKSEDSIDTQKATTDNTSYVFTGREGHMMATGELLLNASAKKSKKTEEQKAKEREQKRRQKESFKEMYVQSLNAISGYENGPASMNSYTKNKVGNNSLENSIKETVYNSVKH